MFKCRYCNGSGIDDMAYQDYTPTGNEDCPMCDGSGTDPSFNWREEE